MRNRNGDLTIGSWNGGWLQRPICSLFMAIVLPMYQLRKIRGKFIYSDTSYHLGTAEGCGIVQDQLNTIPPMKSLPIKPI